MPYWVCGRVKERLDHMYENQFGLKKRPFRANASGTDVFVGPQAARTMSGLKKALSAPDAVVTVSGPVGIGKTTLASVIPRLFEVADGRLFLDGVDANQLPLRTLRSSISMVPQDSFLFSLPIDANIAYGLPD